MPWLHRVCCVAVVFAVAWVGGSRAARAEEPKVGVVVSTFVNLTDQEADDLAAVLGRVLQETLAVQTRSGSEVRTQLGAVADDCTERAACLQEVGSKLGVDQLLMLVVVRVGEKRQVSVIWADVTTGKTETKPPVTISSGQSLDKAFAMVARELLPDSIENRAPPKDATSDVSGGDAGAGGSGGAGGAAGSQGGGVVRGPVDEPKRKIHIATWILGGTGLAALITSGVLGLHSRSLKSDHQTECVDAATRGPAGCADLKSRLETNNTIADSVGAVGIGLLAGGVVTFFLLSETRSENRTVQIAPVAGGGMVTFGGRF